MKVSSKYFTNLLVRESSPIITNREVRFKTSRKVNIPRFPVTSSNVSIIRITVVLTNDGTNLIGVNVTGKNLTRFRDELKALKRSHEESDGGAADSKKLRATYKQYILNKN